MIVYDLESRKTSRKKSNAKFVIYGVAVLLMICLLAAIFYHFYKVNESGELWIADKITSSTPYSTRNYTIKRSYIINKIRDQLTKTDDVWLETTLIDKSTTERYPKLETANLLAFDYIKAPRNSYNTTLSASPDQMIYQEDVSDEMRFNSTTFQSMEAKKYETKKPKVYLIAVVPHV